MYELQLIIHFQTELSMNTHVVVSELHHNLTATQTTVTDTHATVTDTHATVTDTHTIVSDIHRAIVVSQEGTNGKAPSVSVNYILFTVESKLIVN
jgi:hypothetical protein